MNNSKFLKPPLTDIEKERKAEEFLNFSTRGDIKEAAVIVEDKSEIRVFKKERVKAFALRFPLSLADDIAEISALTNLSMNAVCVELLRVAAKQKIKEIKN